MKKITVYSKFTVAILTTLNIYMTLQAQQTTKNNIGKKGFGEMGFSTILLQPNGGDMTTFLGAAFRGGGYISAKSYVGAEVNFCTIANAKQAGTFSYTQTINGNTSTYYDGKIKHSYSATPILLFWNYAPDFSPKLHFNIGPVVGITVFHSSYKFDPAVDNTPKMPSASKTGFNYGAETGLLYDVAKNIYNNKGAAAVGIRYRFLENSGADFSNFTLNGSMHQINLVFNITF